MDMAHLTDRAPGEPVDANHGRVFWEVGGAAEDVGREVGGGGVDFVFGGGEGEEGAKFCGGGGGISVVGDGLGGGGRGEANKNSGI